MPLASLQRYAPLTSAPSVTESLLAFTLWPTYHAAYPRAAARRPPASLPAQRRHGARPGLPPAAMPRRSLCPACPRRSSDCIRATRHTEERRMKRVVAIILGGGAGTRLYPLTKLRAKPAVPLGAKYRLIDIPISNCINSEIQRIYVLTQFNSASLNRHITRTYGMAGFSQGFVEVLAAQQTSESRPSWFEGTADAVRKSLWLFEEWEDVDH